MQNTLESICMGVSFLIKLQAEYLNFVLKRLQRSYFLVYIEKTQLKKETLAQVFSYEVCKISKNTFFTEHIWATASAHVMGMV